MSTTVYLLLAAHILTDLAFQPSWIALNKKMLNLPMLTHAAMNTLAIFLVLFFKLEANQLFLALLIWLPSHLFLDIIKERLSKIKPEWQWPLFGLDQLGHTTVIFILARIFNL